MPALKLTNASSDAMNKRKLYERKPYFRSDSFSSARAILSRSRSGISDASSCTNAPADSFHRASSQTSLLGHTSRDHASRIRTSHFLHAPAKSLFHCSMIGSDGNLPMRTSASHSSSSPTKARLGTRTLTHTNKI